MMKREFVIAGTLVMSLFATALSAAGTAPEAKTASAPAQPPQPQPQFIEEQQSFTIVAVPCQSAATDKTANADKTKRKESGCAAAAEGKSAKKCPNKAACRPAEADYSDDDYALAYELLELTGTPESMDEANAIVITAQMQQAPALKPAHTAFKEFFARHCSYEAMKRDLARIHLETFTRDELKKLIDFFKTPVGKKFARNQHRMLKRCLEVREKRIHANLPELHKNVEQALQAAPQQSETAGKRK